MQEIKNGLKFIPYTSLATVQELTEAKQPKRDKMLSILSEYNIDVLDITEEVLRLSKTYVSEGIIPEKYYDDAIHIAVATVADISIVVSWNFKHIVKLKTRHMVNAINLSEGYRRIEICSPQEVIDYE